MQTLPGPVTCLAVLLAWAVPAFAVDSSLTPHGGTGPAPATLAEAVEAAWARTPERRVLDARQEEADARAERSRSLLSGNPAVRARYQTDEAGSGEGLREYEGGLDLPLWRPGQRGAEADLARVSAEAVTRSDAGRRLLVAGEVRERVWAAALAENAVRLAEQELATARALERDLERRVKAGELARADLLLVRQDTLARESALVQARAEALHALERYARLTGLAALPRHREETPLAGDALPASHPLLAESASGVAEALARMGVARRASGGNPTLSLGVKRQRGDGRTPFDNSVEVAVSVPIGLSSHSRPAVAEAGRALGQTEADHALMVRELEGALDAAGHELAATEERLVLARSQAALAEDALRLARVAFAAGESDLVALLRAQAQAFAAQRARQQLEIERLLGIARYNQAMGVMP